MDGAAVEGTRSARDDRGRRWGLRLGRRWLNAGPCAPRHGAVPVGIARLQHVGHVVFIRLGLGSQLLCRTAKG